MVFQSGDSFSKCVNVLFESLRFGSLILRDIIFISRSYLCVMGGVEVWGFAGCMREIEVGSAVFDTNVHRSCLAIAPRKDTVSHFGALHQA